MKNYLQQFPSVLMRNAIVTMPSMRNLQKLLVLYQSYRKKRRSNILIVNGTQCRKRRHHFLLHELRDANEKKHHLENELISYANVFKIVQFVLVKHLLPISLRERQLCFFVILPREMNNKQLVFAIGYEQTYCVVGIAFVIV